jgi:hypothetical protein
LRLASLNDAQSARTRDLLGSEDGMSSDVDAVVYLLRHAHPDDESFLDGLLDRTMTSPSIVTAVGVLARADQIGGGRLDAMESVARIAERYRSDDRIRRLCADVVPVAGLLAETGRTLTEPEAAALRTIANEDDGPLETMLRSADDFRDPIYRALTIERRDALLTRLGLFGIRYAIQAIRNGEASTAEALARALTEVSGLGLLRRLLNDHFAPRAGALKARSTLLALRYLARTHSPLAAVARDAEALLAGADEFAELRLAQLLLADMRLKEEEIAELRLISGTGTPESRLSVDNGEPAEGLRDAAISGIERWRTRAADPGATPAEAETFELAASCYESIFARVAQSGAAPTS